MPDKNCVKINKGACQEDESFGFKMVPDLVSAEWIRIKKAYRAYNKRTRKRL